MGTSITEANIATIKINDVIVTTNVDFASSSLKNEMFFKIDAISGASYYLSLLLPKLTTQTGFTFPVKVGPVSSELILQEGWYKIDNTTNLKNDLYATIILDQKNKTPDSPINNIIVGLDNEQFTLGVDKLKDDGYEIEYVENSDSVIDVTTIIIK